MQFARTAEEQEIASAARALLEARCPVAVAASDADAGRADGELWQQVSDLGWPGIAISCDHGGLGLGWVQLCILLEEAGARCAPLPLLGSTLAAAALDEAGSDAERERWLPELASGGARAAFGVSRDGVAALVPDAVGADFVVLLDEPTTRVRLVPGEQVRAVATIDRTRGYGTVTCREDFGDRRAERTLEQARIAVGAELVGVARGALQLAVDYVKSRRQFGVPVGAFQGVSHRASEMMLSVEGARVATEAAAWAVDCAPEDLALAAAVAKASASKAAKLVAGTAIQLHGGIGFTWETNVHWYYRRAQLGAAFLGDAAHHYRRLAALLAGAPR